MTKVRGIDHDLELKINFLSCVKHCMEYLHLTNLQINIVYQTKEKNSNSIKDTIASTNRNNFW